MDVFALTRALVDIDSITPNETVIGDWLYEYLEPLAARYDGEIERMEVAPGRDNIWVRWGRPEIVFSTHMDTVPPFIPSREDDEHVWGRGACDTHGICAAMIKASEALLEEGVRDFGILLVVGEEVDGLGAAFANERAPAEVRYLINGEPTSNQLALGSKGTLRLEIRASGKAAHSAYPELGDSAIEKLLDNLESLRRVDWPTDPVLGPSTLNIGVMRGGEAANIVPDRAEASVVIRVVSDLAALKKLAFDALDERVEVQVTTETPAVRLEAVDSFATCVVKYTTDIPKLTQWGRPLLLGPGTIHVAHTREERIAKQELTDAIGLYQRLVKRLKQEASIKA